MRAWSFKFWNAETPMAMHARRAARDGFAVVFLRPGAKEPLCPLTAAEVKKVGAKHPCGVAHASTDEHWVVRTAKRLEKLHGRINIGIAAHASGVVVIDADTPEQVESVQELLRQLGEDEAFYGQQPTVSTPGVERDGVMVHHGGQHWYFNRPDGLELPMYPGEVTLAGGAVMRWGNTYTVVPPSERPEGRYESQAEVIPDVPLGLVNVIRERVITRTRLAADMISKFVNDPVVKWSVETPWHELLEPEGWQFLGKLDRQCGCPVWRRPGEGQTSDRSAIAHENDCEVRENREGHGSLHVFSDNVPGPIGEAVANGQRDFTKLQFIALTQYDGDETTAQIELGLTPDLDWMSTAAPPPHSESSDHESPGQDGAATDEGAEPPKEPQPPHAPDFDAMWEATTRRHLAPLGNPTTDVIGAEILASKLQLKRNLRIDIAKDMYAQVTALSGQRRTDADIVEEWLQASEDTAPTHLIRTDGRAMLPTGRTSLGLGRRGCGKTWIALHLSLEAIDAKQRVAYVDLEDSVGNMRGRFRTMGRIIDQSVSSGHFRRLGSKDVPASLASATVLENWSTVLAEYDVIIFDVLSRLLLRMGGDLNYCNTEVAALYEYLFDPLAFGAGRLVLMLAHPNAAGQRRDADARYIDPAGGATTMNSLSGMAFSMDVVRPFSKEDPNGEVQMWCRKDRSGFGEGELLGTFRGQLDVGSDSNAPSMYTSIEAPDGSETERLDKLTAQVMDRIEQILKDRADGVGPMTRRDICHPLSTRQRKVSDEAIARLIHQHRVVEAGRDRLDLPSRAEP